MDIYQAMIERNALHALLPLLSPDDKAEASQQVAQLDDAIARAQAMEVLK